MKNKKCLLHKTFFCNLLCSERLVCLNMPKLFKIVKPELNTKTECVMIPKPENKLAIENAELRKQLEASSLINFRLQEKNDKLKFEIQHIQINCTREGCKYDAEGDFKALYDCQICQKYQKDADEFDRIKQLFHEEESNNDIFRHIENLIESEFEFHDLCSDFSYMLDKVTEEVLKPDEEEVHYSVIKSRIDEYVEEHKKLKTENEALKKTVDIATKHFNKILDTVGKPACFNSDDCPLHYGAGFDNYCNEQCPFVVAVEALNDMN